MSVASTKVRSHGQRRKSPAIGGLQRLEAFDTSRQYLKGQIWAQVLVLSNYRAACLTGVYLALRNRHPEQRDIDV